MPRNHVIFYNDKTHDGICSVNIVNHFLGDDVKKQFIKYPNKGEGKIQIEEDTSVWYLDVRPKDSEIVSMCEQVTVVYWFHHEYTKFDIFSIKLPNLFVYFNTTGSTSVVLWEKLFKTSIPKIVRLIDHKEMHQLSDKSAELLYDYLETCKDTMSMNHWSVLFENENEVNTILQAGNLISRHKDIHISDAVRRGYRGLIHNQPCIFINTMTYFDEIAREVFFMTDEPIIVVMYYIKSDSTCKVHIRSNEANVGEIAIRMNGTGRGLFGEFELKEFNKGALKNFMGLEVRKSVSPD